MKLRPVGKIVVLLVVVGAAFGGYKLFTNMKSGDKSNAGGGNTSHVTVPGDNGPLGRPLRVVLNPWPGFVGGLTANGGIKPNKECIYWKKYKLLVEYQVMDDPVAMAQVFARGDADIIWSTIDSTPPQLSALKDGGTPSRVFMQVDWSRGGDALLARKGIDSIEDLKGKKVALLTDSPSEYLLRYGLQNSSLDDTEQKAVLTKMNGMGSPDELLAAFGAGQVDAIVTWEPNITAALEKAKGRGAHIVMSTQTIANAVADVFLAKEEFINKNPEVIKAFIDGWFDGTREANKDTQVAADTVMNSFAAFKSLGKDQTLDTFAKVKLADMSDNIKTFGLDGSAPLFDTIYAEATTMYASKGAMKSRVNVKDAKDDSHLKKLYTAAAPAERAPAPKEEFNFSEKQREKAEKAEPVMTKPVNIYFSSGVAELDQNGKEVLAPVLDLLKVSSNAFIRVEGNTDNVGSNASNVELSKKRAQAVVNYLVSKGFKADRFIVKGNGPNKPVASNATNEGRGKNRRTDVQVIAK